MVFSSLSFIFFVLPLFLLLDFISFNKVKCRNISLIIISLLFYTWGEKNYVILLVAMAVFNYLLGHLIYKLSNKKNSVNVDKEKSSTALFVTISCIAINLLCLCFYKYLFFIISNISLLFPSLNIESHPKHLPLGISFFTFHAISYLVDIYRGVIKDRPRAITFFSYFFMFPHLVAGPIVRYADLSNDIENRKKDYDLFCYGVGRFLLGVNKKILIANSMAGVADLAFSLSPEVRTLSDAWLGAIAYSLQIYFDFSGYSDMAIGLAAMAGIKIKENFNSPYLSCSIKEFWRRWHISLSTWFRDYVYIPLGGSRCTKIKIYRNLLIVFILCGFWHGAQWTFLVWGLIHGTLLVFERVFLEEKLQKLPKIISRIYCLLALIIAWVVFRADSLSDAWCYIQQMFVLSNIEIEETINIPMKNMTYLIMLLGIIISIHPLKAFSGGTAFDRKISNMNFFVQFILAIVSISVLYVGARNPFIYFNF